ncbi:MAG TPA: hypothetical protein DD490_16080 [Acidobacteria bacterium]|nr:hypothetical protein [Acidobacteriota bacterium]
MNLRPSALLLLTVALAACGPPAPPRRLAVVHDLVAELPLADVHRETGLIDFGTPGARRHLREGWSWNEGGGRFGPTIVRGKGERSVVDFWLAAPRPLRAEIRCSAVASEASPQALSVLLNGKALGSLSVSAGGSAFTIDLPENAQVAGTNALTFLQSGGIAWDLLRLVPGPEEAAEPPRAERRHGSSAPALLLPPGTEAGWAYAFAEGGTVSLQGVKSAGPGGGTLQVIAQEEGAAEVILATLPAGSGPRTLDLPGRGARLVRLALRSLPAEGPGLLLLAPAVRGVEGALAAEGPAAPPPTAGRPNVIVYLVDTLRADRVGPYRSGRSITPHLDAFAREATVFLHTVAQAPWTKPSVTSIFTGLGPLLHGVRRVEDKLPPEAVTAAEHFQAGGFSTAAFSTNFHVRVQSGLAQGFGHFDFQPDEAASNQVGSRVLHWLDRRPPGPFFLYVHTIDPHAPYTPPADLRKRFAPDARELAGYDVDLRQIYKLRGDERRKRIAELLPLYDAEVAFADQSFGAFLDALRARGLYEGSLIVFVADHGEELGEHGELGHANDLFQEELRIPLLVKWPGQREGREIRALAQQIDLLPTVLAAAGLPVPSGLAGVDLARIAAAGADPRALWDRTAISHLSYRGREGLSAVHAGWKLVQPQTRELAAGPLLFQLGEDPAESVNRLGDAPVRAAWLRSLLRREEERGRSGLKAQTDVMDAETRKALEALGYL